VIEFHYGQLVRCECTFSTSDVSVDPDDVYFAFRAPGDAATTTYHYGVDDEIVKTDTGDYYVDLDASTAGRWQYRWYSTGSGQAGVYREFRVLDAQI